MIPIPFRPLSTDALSEIRSYTLTAPFRNCDFAVPNLYCWQFLYDTEYACVAQFLLLRFHFGVHRRLAYMAPVGTGDLNAVLALMADDAAAQGEELCLCGVSDEQKVRLEALSAEGFHYINDRDYNDYLYLRTSLATLSGKALQPKRNHINRFLRLYPDYEYRPLRATDREECLALWHRWRDHQEVDDGQDDELRAIVYAFDHYDLLGFRGGALCVGGRMVAFTYGSPVNEDTFAVHVEKADADVEGAYTMINKCFAASLPEQYTYLNREEDLGIEGLRRAKLSYHPDQLLHKWMVVQKPQVWDDVRLEQALRALWQTVFADGEAFLDRFFAQYYRRDRVLYTLQQGVLVSALYCLPLRVAERPDLKVCYLYAVSTHPDWRGRGLMTALLRRAAQHLRTEGVDALVLLPADAALTEFYRPLGYRTQPHWKAVCDERYRFLNDEGTGVEPQPFMLLPLSTEPLPEGAMLYF